MKKIFFVLSVIFTLASCSKSSDSPCNEGLVPCDQNDVDSLNQIQ